MKKKYVVPEIHMVLLANEDVMNTSVITTPWIDFDSFLGEDRVDQYQ